MKRFMPPVLALVLAFALACPAFAVYGEDCGPYPETDDVYYAQEDYVAYPEEEWSYYDDYDWEAAYAQERAETIKNDRVSMGGTETGLAVMYNGAYITFPDVQPEYAGGNTMVPLRTLIEALGGEVKYQPETGTVTAAVNGTGISFVIGSDTMEVGADGETSDIVMSCASYVKDGRTYVPVRSVCEAAGYEVIWDSDYETAVILNRSAIISGIDENFTVINKLFQMDKPDYTKTYKMIGDIFVRCTLLDSIDGDRTTDVTVNMKSIQNGLNQETTVTMDLGQILPILNDEFGLYIDDESAGLLSGMSNCSMDLIFNMDEQCMYIKSNLFEAFDMGVDADTWVKFSSEYFGPVMDIYNDMLGSDWYSFMKSPENLTLGTMLYAAQSTWLDYEGVHAYGSLMDAVADLAFLNDGMFVKNGNAYVLNVSLTNSDAFLTAIYGKDYDASDRDEFLAMFRELDCTLKIVDNNGSISASGDFVLRPDSDYTYSPDFRISGSFSVTAREAAVKAEVQVKNVMDLLINMNYTVTETYASVSEAPPEGSTVVDVGDLIMGMYY